MFLSACPLLGFWVPAPLVGVMWTHGGWRDGVLIELAPFCSPSLQPMQTDGTQDCKCSEQGIFLMWRKPLRLSDTCVKLE